MSLGGVLSEGAEIPSSTSTSFVMGGVNLAPSCRPIQWERCLHKAECQTFIAPEGGKTIRSSWLRAFSILRQNTIGLFDTRMQGGFTYHR